MRNSINTHVWTTKSYNVSNFTWHVALLGNVSGEKTTL
jgi:hypothetical protein